MKNSDAKQSNNDVIKTLLAPVNAFLLCDTPTLWIDQADGFLETLLIDHANCEKKAASTALNLIYRYIDCPDLLHKLSRLAREELRHFEQVLSIMQKRGIDYVYVSPSRYATKLREHVAKKDPEKLIDTLIVSAIIEARSCERFAQLVPVLDEELSEFYASLLKSEARHFKDYLKLAKQYHKQNKMTLNLDERIQFFLNVERELVCEPDTEYRFHSGPFKFAE